MYTDAIETYLARPNIVNHFPISVQFEDEEGIDLGGVARDFFSCFWEEAYIKMFDGAALLSPISYAHVDMNQYAVLGKILSHGYLCCGFIPTRIAFPVLASVFFGLSTEIPQDKLLESFLEYLSVVDRGVITQALVADKFTDRMRSNTINILSRFGCRDNPTSQNFTQLLCNLARHKFKSQPFEAISIMNSAIPAKHGPFWQSMTVDGFYELYDAMLASPDKILQKILEPVFNNPMEERVFTYLQQYIGEIKLDEAKRFLRFITGSLGSNK